MVPKQTVPKHQIQSLTITSHLLLQPVPSPTDLAAGFITQRLHQPSNKTLFNLDTSRSHSVTHSRLITPDGDRRDASFNFAYNECIQAVLQL